MTGLGGNLWVRAHHRIEEIIGIFTLPTVISDVQSKESFQAIAFRESLFGSLVGSPKITGAHEAPDVPTTFSRAPHASHASSPRAPAQKIPPAAGPAGKPAPHLRPA